MSTEPDAAVMPHHTDTAAYFRYHAQRAVTQDVRLLPYTAPVVTSRDGVLPTAPPPVAELEAKARAACWTVVREYARGCEPHATTGVPGAERDLHTLRMAKGDQRATAIYSGNKTMSWDSLWVWSTSTFFKRLPALGAMRWWLVMLADLADGMKPAEPVASKRRGPEHVRLVLKDKARLVHYLGLEHGPLLP